MKIERKPFRPFLAALICVGLLGLAHVAPLRAQETGYSITRFGYIEDTIKNRIAMGDLTDRNCGDPSVIGHIAINGKLIGLDVTNDEELRYPLNKVGYLIEDGGRGKRYKVCVFDVAAPHHVDGVLSNGERPEGQLADVSDPIWKLVDSPDNFIFKFEDPGEQSVTNEDQFSIILISPEDSEESIYDFYVSEEGAKEVDVSSEEPDITTITSGTVYDSRMNAEGTGTPDTIPLFEKSTSPFKTVCEPGVTDPDGNFKVTCSTESAEGHFRLEQVEN